MVKLFIWLLVFWQVSAGKMLPLLLQSDRKSGIFPSCGTTANVVYHDFDKHFQGHKIWNVKVLKTVRASKKCISLTFIYVDNCHRMGSLRLVYSVAEAFIFKVKHYFLFICYKVCAGSGYPWQRFALTRELLLLIFAKVRPGRRKITHTNGQTRRPYQLALPLSEIWGNCQCDTNSLKRVLHLRENQNDWQYVNLILCK